VGWHDDEGDVSPIAGAGESARAQPAAHHYPRPVPGERPPSAAGPDAQPWGTDVDAVVGSLATDAVRGLSTAEAAARLASTGPNRLDSRPPVPGWRRFLAEFADPLVYLLLAAVVVSLAVWVIDGTVGVPFDALVIAVILVANAVLGYVQQSRAAEAVAALQRMAAASATLVRDGREVRVAATDVVPGDVLVLAEGDAVSADGRLVDAAALSVSEASLTGESEPVLKDTATLSGAPTLADRVNMVFGGTAVTRGRGRAVVTATGMASEMGRIARLLGDTEQEPTPLQREVAFVGRLLGLVVVAVTVVVVGAILLTSEISDASDLVDVLLVGVSLAVAAVPEGLPAVMSTVLALGVQRMARERAIVKELSSVETLGSASVICSDKTGTLTRNEMTIQRIVTQSGEVQVSGTGYEPEGALLVDGRPLVEGPLLDEVRAVLSGGSLTNDAALQPVGGEWTVIGDPTEGAFLVAARKAGLSEERTGRYERVGEVPFTAERKLMSTVQADAGRGGGLALVTKGAPDVLLARCTHQQVGSAPRPLDEAGRQRVLAAVDRLADDAMRTLGVAYRRLPDSTSPDAGESLEHELVFAGVVGIIDPPREEAVAAIAEARRAGVRVVMITGDHPRTAGRIARDLGIADAGEPAVTGVEIDGLDADALRVVARRASVYARVAPEHKLRIVDALQADGNIVAMTGDGVNDAPALRAADIGVAMGVTGTDVTKEAANMVLADDNFATIVAAVREGRAIFDNIRSFLRYLLSSNAGEVLTMFLGVVGAGLIGLDGAGDIAVPLLATQILWINLLTDTAPALAMGVDPPSDDVMARRPRRPSDRVIDHDMRVGIVTVGLVMAGATILTLDLGLPGGLVDGSRSLEEARTAAFTTLVLAQLFNCFNARSASASAFRHPFTNRLLWGAVALSVLLQVAVVHLPLLHDAFGTVSLDPADWLVCTAMASTVLWVEELRKLVVRRRVSGGSTE
jgi:magnesium-transporting ATPase (P-type)